MNNYMELLQKSLKTNRDSIALMSEGKSHGLTYGVLDRNSGKIYSWLRTNGIGREDFVLICLPRGVRAVVAMIGVLKAGAAFVVVESTYSPERIEFIKKDCGCRLTIDEDILSEMMECEYLEGFEETDPHDAAYAVYTSGTTGNPKGVLHEYGNLMQSVESLKYEGVYLGDSSARFAMVAPLNFVASAIIIFVMLARGGMTYIVPYSIIKNLAKLQEFLISEKITHTFMTASLVRVYRNPSPHLQTIFVSSEPANGISIEGPTLYNLHAMSETGFATTIFRIDRPYNEAPIGKPQFDLGVFILDEDGNPVPDGEMGEFCFENPYIRGYMNLPEKTAESFRDGIFHSGDIAKRNSDGNVVLLGRNDDMIKINGNRIEPAEIEAAVKDVLGLSHVVAKGFDNGKRAYVCAYYLKAEPNADAAAEMINDMEKLNETLLKRIPYYMLPTYYVALDEFPMNANGKLSRKSLKEPDAALYRSEYRAPSSELEQKLCTAFEQALEQDRIGVDDDFYLLGGDSLAAMNLLTNSGVPGFEMGDLFRYHTPARIAEALTERNVTGEDAGLEEAKAKESGWKLDNEQISVVDFQFQEPKSTMWNLAHLFRMKEGTDADRLAAALEKVMRNHGAFYAKIDFNDDCDMVFRYDPAIFTAPEIVDISEKELLENANSLKQPFTRIVGRPLYRCRIYRTEKNIYLFTDIWHIITDGTSLGIFRDEIARAYADPDARLSEDYFFLMLKKLNQLPETDQWQEAKKYYNSIDASEYQAYPAFDRNESGMKMGAFELMLDLEENILASSPLVSSLGRNAFYTLTMALATAAVNGHDKQVVQMLLNGRDSAIKAGTFGLIYRSVPIFFDFGKHPTIGEICEETKSLMQAGTAFSFYPALEEIEGIDECSGVIYQKGIYELGEFGEIADEFIELDVSDASDSVCEVEIIESDEGQCYFVNYSADIYNDETMQTLYEKYRSIAHLLLEYSDRPETKLSYIIENA